MVNKANGTRANDHRANGNRADVVAPEKVLNFDKGIESLPQTLIFKFLYLNSPML